VENIFKITDFSTPSTGLEKRGLIGFATQNAEIFLSNKGPQISTTVAMLEAMAANYGPLVIPGAPTPWNSCDRTKALLI